MSRFIWPTSTSRSTGLSAGLLIGPSILARALTNPKIAEMLTTGLKLSAGSDAAARLGMRLITQLGEDQITAIPLAADQMIKMKLQDGLQQEQVPNPLKDPLGAASSIFGQIGQRFSQ